MLSFLRLRLVFVVLFGLCSALLPSRLSAQRWNISVALRGTATAHPTSMAAVVLAPSSLLQLAYPIAFNPPTDLQFIPPYLFPPSPPISGADASETLVGVLQVDQKMGISEGSGNAVVSTDGAKFHLTFTWDDQGTGEPAPAESDVKVALQFRGARSLYANVTEGTPGSQARTAGASMSLEIDDEPLIGVSASLVNLRSDSRSLPTVLKLKSAPVTLPGTFFASATLDIPFRVVGSLGFTDPNPSQGGGSIAVNGSIGASVSIYVSLSGQVPGRFHLPAVTGAQTTTHTDPTFTRWLPLSFSPSLDSQPFAEEGNFLAAPWGNIHCAYSLAVNQVRTPTSDPLNFDLNGSSVLYGKSIDVDSNGRLQFGERRVFANGDPFEAAFVLTDANGERLLFADEAHGFQSRNDVLSVLTRETDPVSLAQNFVLSSAGPPGAIKSKGEYRYVFETVSDFLSPVRTRLKSLSDRHGNQQTLNWGQGGILTVADQTSGRSLVFEGTPGGYVTAVTAPGGNTTQLTFNSGHLSALKVFAPGANSPLTTETYAYGSAAFPDVVSERTVNGISTQYAYTLDPHFTTTSLPRLQSVSTGGQTLVSYQYGASSYNPPFAGKASRTNTITLVPNDPLLSMQVSLEYLLSHGTYGTITGLNVDAVPYSGGGANRSSVRYSPDIRRPTSLKVRTPIEINLPANAQAWSATLNDYGSLLTVTNPLNQTWQVEYDSSGVRPAQVTDPTGIKARAEYTAAAAGSQLWKVYDNFDALRASFTYNPRGQVTTATVPAAANVINADAVTTLSYHAVTGDLISVTDALGDVLTVDAYDAFGDPLSATVYPTTGQPTTNAAQRLNASRVLDAAQRVTDKTAPNGVRTQNVWGAVSVMGPSSPEEGRLTDIKTYAPTAAGGGLLAQMHVSHDGRGRLATATDLAGKCAEYTYDVLSRLTGIKDGKDNLTSFSYGKNGEPKQVTWAGGGTATLAYDSGGRVEFSTDERGRKVKYSYDAAWRLYEMWLYNANGQGIEEIVHLDYDAAGRVNWITDNSGRRDYTYEPNRKRLVQVTTTLNALPAGSNVFTLDYAYFPDGSVQSVTSNVAGQWQYAYNKAGQLTSLTSPQGTVTAYSYDHIGRLLSQTTGGNLLATSFAYGNSGQAGDTSLAPLSLRTFDYAILGSPRYTVSLEHSYLGQLTHQTIDEINTSTLLLNTFTYDNRGRLESEEVNLRSRAEKYLILQGSYASDLSNNVRPVQTATESEPPNWSFNANNQVTLALQGKSGLAGGTGLSYDPSGNVSAFNGSTLSWDGWGRLTGNGTATYAYDSAGRRIKKTVNGTSTYYLYAGGSLIAEVNASGGLVRSYTWGANGLISDYTASGASSRYYLFDGTGNTFAMVNSAGTLLGVAGFGAWGKSLNSTLPATPFAWKGQAGQFTDSETGLVYCHRRYYSPKLGRWLSRDPIGFGGGINLYGYCGGDPVNFADPSGLDMQLGLGFAEEVAAELPVVTTEMSSGVVGAETTLEYSYVLQGTVGLSSTSETFAPVLAVPVVGEAVLAVGAIAVTGYIAYDVLTDTEPVVAAFNPSQFELAEMQAQICQQNQAIAHGQMSLDLGYCSPTIGELEGAYNSSIAPYNKSLTHGGRALAKHGIRPGTFFPAPTGSSADINELGHDVIGKILGNPRSMKFDHGDVFDIVAPDGRGIRYFMDGKFKGFLEPK